jgi:hypothetical protein
MFCNSRKEIHIARMSPGSGIALYMAGGVSAERAVSRAADGSGLASDGKGAAVATGGGVTVSTDAAAPDAEGAAGVAVMVFPI